MSIGTHSHYFIEHGLELAPLSDAEHQHPPAEPVDYLSITAELLLQTESKILTITACQLSGFGLWWVQNRIF